MATNSTHAIAPHLSRNLPYNAEAVTDAGPAKFAAMVKADSARWATLIRERKITSD